MRTILILASLLTVSPALAQQQQPLSPELVALQTKLSHELQAGLQCTAQMVAASRRINELETELRQIKEKEPQKK